MSNASPQRPSVRPFRPVGFGNFTLLAPLGAGGMGEIFLARSTFQGGLDRFCVIKRILPHLANDPEFVTRFLDEIRTLLQLQHGSIAQVFDAGAYGEEYWISLEFVDGKDLRRLLQRARATGDRLPLELSLFIAIKVLEALGYAHRKKDDGGRELGLVHRDVSPQNILLSYEGEVKIIDFGLAESKTTVAKNPAEMVLGKLYYMAPEQGRGETVDRRSDLYAVGVVLWEMLVGSNPFEALEREELLRRITDPHLPPIQSLDPTLPASVAAVVDRALTPEPFRRFATAEEMRSRLSACLSELAPDVGPEALGKWLTRLFRDDHQRERELFAKLASKEEVASFDPDLETQLIASHRLPDVLPHEGGTEVFLHATPVPWPERPFFPESAPSEEAPPTAGPPAELEPRSPQGEVDAPAGGARSRSRWWIGGAALLLLGALAAWLGGRPEEALVPPAAPPGAAQAPAAAELPPPLDEVPDPPEEVAQLPAPEEEQAGSPVAEWSDHGPDTSLAAPPKVTRPPAARPPPPPPESPPDPEAARAAARARLEATWNDLHRRVALLVDAHGEDRVGTIALQMKQAVETSLGRFIDDSAEYGTLEVQLQALDRIVREREDALR